MNIGENIKAMRKKHGMEQSDLGERLHVSNKTISSWECGRTEPKMGMIEAMCDVFGCEKSVLIDGVEQSSQEHLLKYAELLKSLSDEQQDSVIKYIEFLKSSGSQK